MDSHADTTSLSRERRPSAYVPLWDRLMRHSTPAIAAWAIAMYVFLFLPVVVLVLFSFNRQKMNVKWTGFTLHWYDVLLHDPVVQKAFFTSLGLALASTGVALVFGTLGAFAVERFRFKGRGFWVGLNYTKVIVAEIVAGVSSLVFFSQLQVWLISAGFDFWGIFELGLLTVLMAHIAWSVPYVTIIVRTRLKGFDQSLEEAGADLGARPRTVFFRVTLPAIAPGLIAAGLLAFTFSFDDFVTTFFVAGPDTNTLPLQIWGMVRMGISPEINALCTLMLLVSSVLIVVAEVKARVSSSLV